MTTPILHRSLELTERILNAAGMCPPVALTTGAVRGGLGLLQAASGATYSVATSGLNHATTQAKQGYHHVKHGAANTMHGLVEFLLAKNTMETIANWEHHDFKLSTEFFLHKQNLKVAISLVSYSILLYKHLHKKSWTEWFSPNYKYKTPEVSRGESSNESPTSPKPSENTPLVVHPTTYHALGQKKSSIP